MSAFPSDTSEIIITPKLGVRKIGGIPLPVDAQIDPKSGTLVGEAFAGGAAIGGLVGAYEGAQWFGNWFLEHGQKGQMVFRVMGAGETLYAGARIGGINGAIIGGIIGVVMEIHVERADDVTCLE